MTAALYPQEGSKLRKWNGYSDFKDSMVPWIGPVPRNWGVGPVKRCCSFRAGSGFPHEEQGLTEGDLPFYKVGDMNSGGNDLYLHRSQNYVTLHTARRLGATIFAAGTIVFPKVGAALLTNKRRMLAQPACIDNNVMGMTVRNGVRKWFYYWFSTIDLGRLANPGAVPSINESQVKDIVLALPPVHDQEAITCQGHRIKMGVFHKIGKSRHSD